MFSYAFVLLNDLFTAGNGIIIKQKLDTKDLGKNGLLFYNCLFMIPPALIVFFMTEDLSRIIGNSSQWRNSNKFIRLYLKSLTDGATRYLWLSSCSPVCLASSWCSPWSSAPATTRPSPPPSSAAWRTSSSPTLAWSSGETTDILSLTSLVLPSVF